MKKLIIKMLMVCSVSCFAQELTKQEETQSEITAKVLNSKEYKRWKMSYLLILKLINSNISIINNLEKKYSFRNNYGNLVYDENNFSKVDKIIYNKNYEAIGKKLETIKNLQELSENEKFLNIYENLYVSFKTINIMELYNYSQFYNNHEKIN